MEYRRLGRTGLKVSTICLGTMQFGWTADESTSQAVMTRAIDLGCNFFDTADIYSSRTEDNELGISERFIGRWLAQGIVQRHEVVLATKVRGQMGEGPNDQGLSRQHIMNAVDDSLRRLGTDYIDLYQVHWPDEETPLEETLAVLTDLVRAGKVRYIGCSNYPAWLLAKALWISDVRGLARFDSVQPHYNLVRRAEFERELQPLCLDQGVGVIPYSPLAGGFLTGKYSREAKLPQSARAEAIQKRYMHESGFAALDKLGQIAQTRKATMAQIAVAWVLANPAVTSAIIGANSVDQLNDTIAGGELHLTAAEKEALDNATAF